MKFSIEKLTAADERALLSGDLLRFVERFGKVRFSTFDGETPYRVVDPDAETYLMLLKEGEVLDTVDRCLLVVAGLPVMLRLSPDSSSIRILGWSDALFGREREIESVIRAAFRVGGRFCSGVNRDVVDTVDPTDIEFPVR